MIKKFLISKYLDRSTLTGWFTIIYNLCTNLFKRIPELLNYFMRLPWFIQEAILLFVIIVLLEPIFKFIDFIEERWEKLKDKLTTGKFKL